MSNNKNDFSGVLLVSEAPKKRDPKSKLKARSPNLTRISILYWRCKKYCLPRIGNNKSAVL